jgi:hypothetical protein
LAGLEKDRPRSERCFALIDDLGAGHDYLNEHAEAVRLLRDKLRQQQAQGLTGRALYTSYANLGTFLIHGAFGQAQRGEPGAKEQMREGLAFLRRSIEVNPEAHFGREVWQANAVEFFLKVLDRPEHLLKADMIGNDLYPPDPDGPHFGSIAVNFWLNRQVYYRAAAVLRSPSPDPEELTKLRSDVPQVGPSVDGSVAEPRSNLRRVPFDEPALGIIGMWRLGGGANPHFCLALAEIMRRVEQRYLAWCAYERAVMLAPRFWPSPALQQKLVGHCRRWQAAIAKELPEEESARLRPRFQAELAFGQGYQRAYQDYEARRIREGVALDDPTFYDAFFAERGRIETPPGPIEVLIAKRPLEWYDRLPGIVFFAGCFALAMGAWLRLRRGRQDG